MTISRNVVQTDARLEKAANTSRLDLAKHRWHWTLDEANTKRVSIREYARQVGRGEATIRHMVNGYTAWAGAASDVRRGDLEDYLARARIKDEALAATEAVAEAKGISLEAARVHHAPEIREVKATAEERAERKGTTPREEMQPVAQSRQQVRQASTNIREQKKAAHTLRYIEAEGKISMAMRSLKALLNDTSGVEFNAEETALLTEAMGRLKALLNLLDVQIIGATDVDWDAEMAKMTAGDPS